MGLAPKPSPPPTSNSRHARPNATRVVSGINHLLVTFALPNPAGKDRSASVVSNTQLNGEWVEFKNNLNQAVSLDGVALVHQTYNQGWQRTGSDSLMMFKGPLGYGESVRVHTGSGETFKMEASSTCS